MTIKYYTDLIQGSDEWIAARCGLLTASEMHLIITPTLKVADNDKSRSHLNELLAQRISRYVEPAYVSDDMLRGQQDELDARALYHTKYHAVEEMGFITNDKWGFTLGYSPDGLVGHDRIIECKGRRQKFQVDTIINRTVPPEFVIQCQTGMLVSERDYCDFISYSGGWPMVMIEMEASKIIQDAILDAAEKFEKDLKVKFFAYITASRGLHMTERRVIQEMHL